MPCEAGPLGRGQGPTKLSTMICNRCRGIEGIPKPKWELHYTEANNNYKARNKNMQYHKGHPYMLAHPLLSLGAFRELCSQDNFQRHLPPGLCPGTPNWEIECSHSFDHISDIKRVTLPSNFPHIDIYTELWNLDSFRPGLSHSLNCYGGV